MFYEILDSDGHVFAYERRVWLAATWELRGFTVRARFGIVC